MFSWCFTSFIVCLVNLQIFYYIRRCAPDFSFLILLFLTVTDFSAYIVFYLKSLCRQLRRGGGGGGGGGGEGGGACNPIYGIVRMCVPNSPLFQRCQVYDWPPFFYKKYMNGPNFLDSYVKGPIFLTSWYMHIFLAQRFFEAAYPLGIIWINCDICVITSKKMGTKNQRAVYE